MKIIQIILEIIGWLSIAGGTTLGAALISFIVYTKWQNEAGKTVAVIILIIGFIAGAIWATIIWKKYGTVEWLSGIRKTS